LATDGVAGVRDAPENYDNLTFHRVPEPGTLSVFAMGILFLCLMGAASNVMDARVLLGA
jgi:hypothetical protein